MSFSFFPLSFYMLASIPFTSLLEQSHCPLNQTKSLAFYTHSESHLNTSSCHLREFRGFSTQ